MASDCTWRAEGRLRWDNFSPAETACRGTATSFRSGQLRKMRTGPAAIKSCRPSLWRGRLIVERCAANDLLFLLALAEEAAQVDEVAPRVSPDRS